MSAVPPPAAPAAPKSFLNVEALNKVTALPDPERNAHGTHVAPRLTMRSYGWPRRRLLAVLITRHYAAHTLPTMLRT